MALLRVLRPVVTVVAVVAPGALFAELVGEHVPHAPRVVVAPVHEPKEDGCKHSYDHLPHHNAASYRAWLT